MRITVNQGRWFRWNSTGINPSMQFTPVGSLELFARDGFIGPLPPSDHSFTNSGAVAIGAALNLGTVTAGKMPLVTGYTVCATVAGGYWLRYNGVAIAQLYLSVNTPFDIANGGKGFLLTAKGGIFDILNNTGAAVSIAGFVAFSEHSG